MRIHEMSSKAQTLYFYNSDFHVSVQCTIFEIHRNYFVGVDFRWLDVFLVSKLQVGHVCWSYMYENWKLNNWTNSVKPFSGFSQLQNT
jgi:hypothetical protein